MNDQTPQAAATPDGAASALTVGLELIDPDFLGDIERSLMEMIEYADLYLSDQKEALAHPRNSTMLGIIETDIRVAEERLDRLRDWFMSSNVE